MHYVSEKFVLKVIIYVLDFSKQDFHNIFLNDTLRTEFSKHDKMVTLKI